MPSNAPSRTVLLRASEVNAALGHENLGFLSEGYGFAPSVAPVSQMPPSHRAWDEVVEQLPTLFRTLRLRQAVDSLPVLSGRQESFPDRFLLRASGILSMLAHSYVRVRTDPPRALPPSIQKPWEEVSRRLGRSAPFLSYIDLIIYNWRLRDPGLPDLMRLENLELMIPTVGTQDEEVLYLTQVEMLAQGAPIVSAATRAQDAIIAQDVTALERELLRIIERLQHVGEVSFQKVDPNPRSASFLEPVAFAKTVAPFAVPINDGVPGPSGASFPILHLMDVFLGRNRYESLIGEETLQIRAWYPQHWLDFLEAVSKVSLRDFVADTGDSHLQEVFQALVDAYAGDKGFLGLHRLKVYGYLESAFRLGRSVTIGGFEGTLRDRIWRAAHSELGTTRDERYPGLPTYTSWGVPISDLSDDEIKGVRPTPIRTVRFDVGNSGLQCRPGDRLGVLAENSPELIDKTLRSLRASGEETIRLDQNWALAVRDRYGIGDVASLLLGRLLSYGKLRPVQRDIAKALYAITASSRLKQIINARSEDQWELWDLLDMLYESGFDTRQLWKAEPWEAESICKIVPPEGYRPYSIASSVVSGSGGPRNGERRIDLTVARLEYQTPDGPTSPSATRYGTASNYLHRIMNTTSEHDRPVRVPLQVTPAPRFQLPADHSQPIVMFAGGAGIGPFHGFIQERLRHRRSGENWLFFGTRSPDEFLSRELIESAVRQHALQVRVAFSRADLEARFVRGGHDGRFEFIPGNRRRIDSLIEESENSAALWKLIQRRQEGGGEACFYVCGQAGFATSVMESLMRVIQHHCVGENDDDRSTRAKEIFYQLVADRRYMQDVFSTYSGAYHLERRTYNASDIVLHNSEENGYWFVIGGRVYDMTEFLHIHPGGDQIIRNNIGIDASQAYQSVRHHRSSEVEAMLAMYEIGTIRRLDFKLKWGVRVSGNGLTYVSLEDAFREWVRYLYLISEMENTLATDYSFMRIVTTLGESPEMLTPLKIQAVVETHSRFVTGYLDGLVGEDLRHLWSTTTGLCSATEDIRRLGIEVEQIAANDAHPPVPQHNEHCETADPLHHRTYDAADLRHFQALFPKDLVQFHEFLSLVVFLRVGFYHMHAAQVLLNMAAENRHLMLYFEGAFEYSAAEFAHGENQEGERQQGGQSHARIDREHKRESVDVVKRRVDEVEYAGAEHHAHGRDIVDDPRHQVAGALGVIVGQG
jgi:cytochrome b involved in lipid metabolism